MPRVLANTLAALTFVFGLYQFGGFVTETLTVFISEFPVKYDDKIREIFAQLFGLLGSDVRQSFMDLWLEFDYLRASSDVLAEVSNFAKNIWLIAFYMIFLFLEYSVFDTKIDNMFSKKVRKKYVSVILAEVNKDVGKYLQIKVAVSLIVAVASYIVLMLFGVDLASFWALLIFVLNFIPYVGSIVAVIFPVALALVQFDPTFMGFIPWQFPAILLSLVGVQMAVGNILEPRLMGKTLNVSPLVILIALTVWGSIWGIVGMFLCVPITFITNIILSKFEKTRPIAVLLSQSGEIVG